MLKNVKILEIFFLRLAYVPAVLHGFNVRGPGMILEVLSHSCFSFLQTLCCLYLPLPNGFYLPPLLNSARTYGNPLGHKIVSRR